MRYLATLAAAAALALAGAGTTAADAAGVTVLHGAHPSQAAGGHVTVLRGTGFAVAEAAAPAKSPPAMTPVAGGSLLWLVDADGQVTACGVRGSGVVGAPDVIRCSAGPVVP